MEIYLSKAVGGPAGRQASVQNAAGDRQLQRTRLSYAIPWGSPYANFMQNAKGFCDSLSAICQVHANRGGICDAIGCIILSRVWAGPQSIFLYLT